MEEACGKVGFEIRRLDHTISRTIEAWVKAEGIDEIPLMNGWIMRYLYENRKKDIFQKDIEKFFSIGRSTVTNIIQILEKKGYVRRESVEYDARLKKVILTEQGIESHEKIEAIIGCLNHRMIQGIEDDDLQEFLRVADQIRRNVEKEKL